MDERDGLSRAERLFDDSRVAKQYVKFDQNKLADYDCASSDRQGAEERARTFVLRTIAIERIKKKIRIEGNHRALAGSVFVGQEPPIFNRGKEWS